MNAAILLPVGKMLGGLVAKLIQSKKTEDIIAGLLLERSKEMLEGFARANAHVERATQGSSPNTIELDKSLVDMWLAERLEDAQAITRRAAAIAEEQIDVQQVWNEALAEVSASFSKENTYDETRQTHLRSTVDRGAYPGDQPLEQRRNM